MDSRLQISLLLFFQSILLFSAPSLATKKTYIVHMDPTHKPSTFSTPEEWYSAHLTQSLSSTTSATAVSTTTTNTISPSPMLYSYTTAYDGYAASLSADELAALESSGGDAILGIYEDEVYPLHTTRTPEFLGLDSPSVTEFSDYSSPASGPASSDVIVGVLDTGIWPESASFDDTGLPPIPSKWRGECEYAADFKPSHCNKKLIGARIFARGAAMARPNYLGNPTEMDSPRDYEGHGTHTASTAAGSRAPNASLLGYASGIARGMAPPRARIASYKVCGSTGCFGSDILAGIDRAILDGVDVLSLSLGGGSTPYYRDPIAVGAFSAMVKGIFVSASAGNSGPTKSSLANTAPWIMTVGAGTLDRDFPAYATLGDGKRVAGVSLYSGKGTGKKFFSLVYGNGDASATSNSSSASGTMCLAGTLDRRRVSGKVVLCDRGVTARAEKGAVVRDAGGIGMILANTAVNGEEMVADSHLIPAVAVGQREGDTVREYVRGAGKKAKVALSFDGTVLGVRPSPVVAAFSSRGPNTVTPQILKPDVIGPGVNILAAWSEAVGPTTLDKDSRRSKFNIMSGTSMSCPHISGLAALIKAAHPDWSPSAIKSALMTTAYIHDNTRAPLHDAADNSISNPWAYGAGHVNPRRALSPGLVYDITPQEYVSFLCTLGYTPNRVQLVTKMPNVTCSTNKFTDPGQLNYPAFSVVFGKASRVVRYTRELTNVGPARSFYQVIVDAPKGVGVKVRPTKMFFRQAGEKKKYTVTFVAKKGKKVVVPTEKSGFGSVMWFNKQNQVRSPVSFMWS